MLQNHMMQLLAVTAIEPPARWESERVRDERAKFFIDNWRWQGVPFYLTLPILNAARKVIFVISGEAKGRVVREIEERVEGFRRYPAAHVRATVSTLWFVAAGES